MRERHDLGPSMLDVLNELVAVPTDGSAEPRTIVGGHDFFSSPRISADGATLAWLAWDLPWMPWDGTELFVAPLSVDAELGDATPVAGRAGEESIWDPEWSPSGDLVFASDRSGWWNLERVRDGVRTVVLEAEAEFGYPQWGMGEHSITFLSDGRIACHYDRDGDTHTAIVDPETGELVDLDLPLDALRWGPGIRAEGSTIVLTAGSATEPDQVIWLDFAARSIEVLRQSSSVPVDAGLPLGPGGDRVSDRRRPARARVLLPADQSGRGRTRGGSPAADRDQPWRARRARTPPRSISVCSSSPPGGSAWST